MGKVVRYIIKANGREVSWTFSRKEAETRLSVKVRLLEEIADKLCN